MINIYFWRTYYQKFKNFNKFVEYDFEAKNIPIYRELMIQMQMDRDDSNSIFKENSKLYTLDKIFSNNLI